MAADAARDDLHSWSPKALRAEVRRLRHLLGSQMHMGTEFEVEGIVNPKGAPFVHMRWGTEAAQMTPDEARRTGLIFSDTAAAAEWDAAFVKVLQDPQIAGNSMEEATAFLQVIRAQRTGEINAALRRSMTTRRPPRARNRGESEMR